MKQRDVIVLAVIAFLMFRKKGPPAPVGPVTSTIEDGDASTAQVLERGAKRGAKQVELGPATVTPSNTVPGSIRPGG